MRAGVSSSVECKAKVLNLSQTVLSLGDVNSVAGATESEFAGYKVESTYILS